MPCRRLHNRILTQLSCPVFSPSPSLLGLLSVLFPSPGLCRCCSSAWNTPFLHPHLPNSYWFLRHQLWDHFIKATFATSLDLCRSLVGAPVASQTSLSVANTAIAINKLFAWCLFSLLSCRLVSVFITSIHMLSTKQALMTTGGRKKRTMERMTVRGREEVGKIDSKREEGRQEGSKNQDIETHCKELSYVCSSLVISSWDYSPHIYLQII